MSFRQKLALIAQTGLLVRLHFPRDDQVARSRQGGGSDNATPIIATRTVGRVLGANGQDRADATRIDISNDQVLIGQKLEVEREIGSNPIGIKLRNAADCVDGNCRDSFSKVEKKPAQWRASMGLVGVIGLCPVGPGSFVMDGQGTSGRFLAGCAARYGATTQGS